MGKEEEKQGEITSSSVETNGNPTEKNEEEGNNDKKSEEPAKEPEKKEEETPEKKKDAEELRKVIKVDSQAEDAKPEEKKEEQNVDLEGGDRETLEQKRVILQSIKDFDFQIKKNSEEITGLNEKLENVSKDLDDLVSLYEIVSEQMNPFVGLSKVTKKRIDALENFTKEIDDLKNRMGDIESFAERAGANLQELKELRPEYPERDSIKEENPENIENEKVVTPNLSVPEIEFSNGDIDVIIEKSLNSFYIDYKIDMVIDEFIESLKL